MTGTRATVTYDMLIDALRPFPLLSRSPVTQREFQWASSIHWERGFISEKSMVIVCREKTIQQASELYPEAFLVILSCESDISSLDIPNQYVIVKARADDGVLQKLQNMFLRIQSWQSELRGTSRDSNRTFDEMLRRSSDVINAPLVLYGLDGRIVGKSLSTSTPPMYKSFTGQEKDIFDFISLLRRTPVCFSNAGTGVYVDHRLIRLEGEKLYYLVALYPEQPSKGQQDLLDKLAQAVLGKSSKTSALSNLARRSVYALFNDLISRRYVGRSYLDDYASLYGFALDAEFRLLRFKQKTGADIVPHGIIEQVRKFNKGKVLVAVYNGDLLALLHSKDLDSSLSTQEIEEELEGIAPLFDGYVTVSQVFNDVTNFAFAYEQTSLIAKYREHIDICNAFTQATRLSSKLCYTFEEALTFALVDSDITQEMRDFAFSHTILEKIIAEDRANGGEDTRILASYLNHERKATAVAEELHMHRNTVLYRIDKIEKRFGLDFDNEWSRNRVTLDFTILYCKLAKDSLLKERFFGSFEEKKKMKASRPSCGIAGGAYNAKHYETLATA